MIRGLGGNKDPGEWGHAAARVWTLLVQSHAEVREAVRFVFRAEPLAEDFPTLFVGLGRKKRRVASEESNAVEPVAVAPVTAEPTVAPPV